WLPVVSGWALLAGLSLSLRPLLPVDETRYASVAWEMWNRGDFLVPHLNGVPYSDKPPLLFWLFHLGWRLFGVDEWWPRLVPALCSLANLFLTAALARRLWPDRPRHCWPRHGWPAGSTSRAGPSRSRRSPARCWRWRRSPGSPSATASSPAVPPLRPCSACCWWPLSTPPARRRSGGPTTSLPSLATSPRSSGRGVPSA